MDIRTALVLLALTVWTVGCDYGRRGGAYRVEFANPSPASSTVVVENSKAGDVYVYVKDWLTKNEYKEFVGDLRTTWNKGGARVYVHERSRARLVISFAALGYKRDLRLSEQTERELVKHLQTLPGISVTRTDQAAAATRTSPHHE